MWPMLILFVQTTTPPPIRIDLTAPIAATTCKPSADGDEVVVCGGRDSPYRLRRLPPVSDASALPKAETSIRNAKAGVETEQAGVGGFTSNRVMFRLKMPF